MQGVDELPYHLRGSCLFWTTASLAGVPIIEMKSWAYWGATLWVLHCRTSPHTSTSLPNFQRYAHWKNTRSSPNLRMISWSARIVTSFLQCDGQTSFLHEWAVVHDVAVHHHHDDGEQRRDNQKSENHESVSFSDRRMRNSSSE